jgi:flagellar hook assembly protein FlgD
VETTIPSAATELHQNYPNPFNPATTIAFTLAQKSAVNLSIFTPDGKLVVTLVDGVLPAGFTDVPWDGKDTAGNYASSGIYLYRLKAGKTVLSRKMVYLK